MAEELGLGDDPSVYETAECALCGQAPIHTEEDAYCCLRGMFMRSREYDAPIFVLDPDTKIRVIQLANGQLALVTDVFDEGPTKHIQAECLHETIKELGGRSVDPDPDEEADEVDYLRRRS